MSEFYCDAHRYFLQSIMQRGVVNDQECKVLLEKSCEMAGEDAEEHKIHSFMTLINKQIQPFHLEVRKGIDEDDGSDVYALISITDHDINHLAVGGYFSKAEIEIFHRIVDHVIASDEGTVSSTDVLNLTEDLPQKNISKSDVEVLLIKLMNQQWIGEKDGIIFLSPRTILELEPYLKSQFPDVIDYCSICKNMVLRGHRCSSCNCRIHNYCASTYFRGISERDRKCPSCYNPMSISDLHDVRTNGNYAEQPVTSERRKRRR